MISRPWESERARPETRSVVADHDLGGGGVDPALHHDRRCAGVTDRVRHRLLGDAQQLGLDLGAQPDGSLVDADPDRDPGAVAQVTRQTADGAAQAVAGADLGPQALDRTPHLGDDAGDPFAQRAQLRRLRRGWRTVPRARRRGSRSRRSPGRRRRASRGPAGDARRWWRRRGTRVNRTAVSRWTALGSSCSASSVRRASRRTPSGCRPSVSMPGHDRDQTDRRSSAGRRTPLPSRAVRNVLPVSAARISSVTRAPGELAGLDDERAEVVAARDMDGESRDRQLVANPARDRGPERHRVQSGAEPPRQVDQLAEQRLRVAVRRQAGRSRRTGWTARSCRSGRGRCRSRPR